MVHVRVTPRVTPRVTSAPRKSVVHASGEHWTLICADFTGPNGLSVLDTAHTMIDDPPFEAKAHANCVRTKSEAGKQRIQKVKLGFEPITEAEREFLVRWSLARLQRWSLIFGQLESMGRYEQLFGAAYWRSMVWVKPNGQPQKNGKGPGQGTEAIACAWCGPKRLQGWNGGGRHGVYTASIETARRIHTTQKPIYLLEQFVRDFSNAGELIVDAHVGSGTHGVAAVRAGRKFMGWERDPKMFALAAKRLSQVHVAPELFDRRAVQPKQISFAQQAREQLDINVFNIIDRGPTDGTSVTQINEKLRVTEAELRSCLRRLIKQALIRQEGRTASTKYFANTADQARTG